MTTNSATQRVPELVLIYVSPAAGFRGVLCAVEGCTKVPYHGYSYEVRGLENLGDDRKVRLELCVEHAKILANV